MLSELLKCRYNKLVGENDFYLTSLAGLLLLNKEYFA